MAKLERDHNTIMTNENRSETRERDHNTKMTTRFKNMKKMMTQEDELEENDSNVGVVSRNNSRENKVVADKVVLPWEQREYIRFMNVRRKKDFIYYERVNGKWMNILDSLELHTGILSAAEQKRIVNYVSSLQEMGRKEEFKGF